MLTQALKPNTVINLFTWTAPNGRKASIAIEEMELPYIAHPVDIGSDEQFKPDFLKQSVPTIAFRPLSIATPT